MCEAVADMVSESGSSVGSYLGRSGYSFLGAVVGATHVGDIANLRNRMLHQLILVPGYGAQGGTAEHVRASFSESGEGAVITASRSVIYAFEQDPDVHWQKKVEDATITFKKEIAAILNNK